MLAIKEIIGSDIRSAPNAWTGYQPLHQVYILLNRLTPPGLNKCRRHIVTTTNWYIIASPATVSQTSPGPYLARQARQTTVKTRPHTRISM